MVSKCNNCGGRVKFNIEKQLFNCENCNQLIDKAQIENVSSKFERYHCASCGAELNVIEGEMTSDCPYCGAQSIVFSGREEEYEIDYIIPFKVTYNNAINIIRSEFDTYKYTPKKVKDFQIENVRPLYIPYYLYDVTIDTRQVIEGVKHSENQEAVSCRFEYIREIKMDYKEIEIDMVSKLPKDLALGLGPWDMNEREEFNPAYIAGLYASAVDVDEEIGAMEGVRRAKTFINNKIMRTCKGTENKVIEAKYDHEVTGKKAILLPVWFFTSSYKGQKYSVVINGQTGKIISAVPYFKPVFVGMAAGISALAAVIIGAWSALGCGWFLLEPGSGFLVFLGLGAAYVAILAKGNKSYKSYREKVALLNKSEVVELAKESRK